MADFTTVVGPVWSVVYFFFLFFFFIFLSSFLLVGCLEKSGPLIFCFVFCVAFLGLLSKLPSPPKMEE